MPKDFQAWYAEQLGSIPDPYNTWADEKLKKSHDVEKLSEFQIRSLFANLLIGKPDDEDSLTSWMEVFCSKYSHITGEIEVGGYTKVLGRETKEEYFSTEGNKESIIWFENFYKKIWE